VKEGANWGDIYFENVGGETLDAVLLSANKFCRIVACGMISQYGQQEPYRVKNIALVVGKQIRLQGFIQTDLRQQYLAVFPPLLTLNGVNWSRIS
jgi:NADPH-dependent curcumin reductase CurA